MVVRLRVAVFLAAFLAAFLVGALLARCFSMGSAQVLQSSSLMVRVSCLSW